MKKAFILFALFSLSSAPLLSADPAKDFFFKNNDRILFIGDSITEQYEYSSYIELYLTTRFPAWRLSFLNAGIGGDRAVGGNARFADHVLKEKPTAVTINFGMNDFGYQAFNPKLHEPYVANTEAMLKTAGKAGLRIALFSPNTVEFRFKSPYNPQDQRVLIESQKQFYAPLKELAARHGATFVDQYSATRNVIETLEAGRADNVKPFPDTVHTGPAGGLLMAHSILVGLNAPAEVSHADIQVGVGLKEARNCIIEQLQSSPTSVSFDRTDAAMPLPIQKDWFSMLPYLNFLRDLNWYGLQVRGLEPGRYTLHIDGQALGTFTHQQFADGINAGNFQRGPVFDHSQKVFNAVTAKNKLVHARFRNVVMFGVPNWETETIRNLKETELTKRMKEIDAKQADIYQLVQPVKHRFEIKSIG